jgi:hypothetical protein
MARNGQYSSLARKQCLLQKPRLLYAKKTPKCNSLSFFYSLFKYALRERSTARSYHVSKHAENTDTNQPCSDLGAREKLWLNLCLRLRLLHVRHGVLTPILL